MVSSVAAAFVQISLLGASPLSYEQAYKENEQSGKPLVVLIGAEWCPACKVMKNATMPQVAKDGVFHDVAFTVVDADKQPQVAKEMLSSGGIPQLVMFHRTADGWRHERLIGAQSPSAVVNFLRRGIRNAADRLTK